MKSIKYIIVPALAAFMFTACNNEVKGPSQADLDAQVEAKVKSATDQLKSECDARIQQTAQMQADSIVAKAAGKKVTPAPAPKPAPAPAAHTTPAPKHTTPKTTKPVAPSNTVRPGSNQSNTKPANNHNRPGSNEAQQQAAKNEAPVSNTRRPGANK